jgi:hypothetical protein
MSNDIDISDLSADTQDAYAFYKQIQSFEPASSPPRHQYRYYDAFVATR